jgi:hypothetical protein
MSNSMRVNFFLIYKSIIYGLESLALYHIKNF